MVGLLSGATGFLDVSPSRGSWRLQHHSLCVLLLHWFSQLISSFDAIEEWFLYDYRLLRRRG